MLFVDLVIYFFFYLMKLVYFNLCDDGDGVGVDNAYIPKRKKILVVVCFYSF